MRIQFTLKRIGKVLGIAFAVAIFFTTHVEGGNDKNNVTAAEIWYRLPKFIIGFFAASLIASFIFLPLVGKDSVSGINKVLDQYKNWAFVLRDLMKRVDLLPVQNLMMEPGRSRRYIY